jgi:pimeloyl-ACP methyl ester carboxylesterase
MIAAALVCITVLLFIRNGGLDSDRDEARRLYGGPPSRFVALDGAQLHYRDEGRGPPLVLLHGSRASLHQWDGWVAELRDEFRLIRVDARAHGLSNEDGIGDYSPDRGVELLRLLLDELDIEQFYLGGTSSGAVQAVHFAAAYPERVRQLLLSTVPLKLPAAMETPLRRRAVFWLHQRILNSTSTSWYWRHFLEGIYADPKKVTDELVQRYRILNSQPGRRQEQQRLIDKWYELGGPERDYELAARVTTPVFIQWGAAGPVLPLELQCEIARAFSATDVRVVTYSDLGHKLAMEDAARTARDAVRYLRGEEVGSSCASVLMIDSRRRNP